MSAVAARMELDLRLGAAFTRFTTLTLQSLGPPLAKTNPKEKKQPISYGEMNHSLGIRVLLIHLSGSCQFPTLGFVVDRYFKVQSFIPEKFWSIKVMHRHDGLDVIFSWRRHRLFDRACVVILFEKCILARVARVIKLQKKPTSKWRPLPLTTVELQKLGSMFLRMQSSRVMKVSGLPPARVTA